MKNEWQLNTYHYFTLFFPIFVNLWHVCSLRRDRFCKPFNLLNPIVDISKEIPSTLQLISRNIQFSRNNKPRQNSNHETMRFLQCYAVLLLKLSKSTKWIIRKPNKKEAAIQPL